MSYILKALRKSDAQRRLGQVPDLDTGTPASYPAEVGRGGRSRPMLILLLLILLTLMLGWLLADPVRQWLAGGDDAVPPALEDAVPPLLTPELAGDPAQGTPAEPTPEDDSAPVVAAADADVEEAPRQTLPVAMVSRPAPRRVVDAPRRQPEPELPARPQLPSPAAAPAPAAATMPDRAQPPPRVAEPRQEAAPWTPERTEYLRQWELPLAIRRELPAMDLSIHVFSPEPRGRFVLINGERRMEGDDLGQGAQLIEIRREGALVQFRDYRILIEP